MTNTHETQIADSSASRARTTAVRPPSTTIQSSDRGKTYVAEEVVATIARIAAEEVEGVYSLGATGIRGAFGRMARNAGVESEVGMTQAVITLDVVMEYGYRLTEVAAELRARVVAAVSQLAARDVITVDISIVDVHVVKPAVLTSRVLE